MRRALVDARILRSFSTRATKMSSEWRAPALQSARCLSHQRLSDLERERYNPPLLSWDDAYKMILRVHFKKPAHINPRPPPATFDEWREVQEEFLETYYTTSMWALAYNAYAVHGLHYLDAAELHKFPERAKAALGKVYSTIHALSSELDTEGKVGSDFVPPSLPILSSMLTRESEERIVHEASTNIESKEDLPLLQPKILDAKLQTVSIFFIRSRSDREFFFNLTDLAHEYICKNHEVSVDECATEEDFIATCKDPFDEAEVWATIKVVFATSVDGDERYVESEFVGCLEGNVELHWCLHFPSPLLPQRLFGAQKFIFPHLSLPD